MKLGTFKILRADDLVVTVQRISSWSTLIAAVLVLCPPTAAVARNAISKHSTWAVYKADEGCYVRGSAAGLDPAVPERGENYVQVSHFPLMGSFDVVFVLPGYTYVDGSRALASVDGGSSFSLDEDGYKSLAPDDVKRKLVAAMREGHELVVTGLAEGDVRTTDRYPLEGFPEAYAEISQLCERMQSPAALRHQAPLIAFELVTKDSGLAEAEQDALRDYYAKRVARLERFAVKTHEERDAMLRAAGFVEVGEIASTKPARYMASAAGVDYFMTGYLRKVEREDGAVQFEIGVVLDDVEPESEWISNKTARGPADVELARGGIDALVAAVDDHARDNPAFRDGVAASPPLCVDMSGSIWVGVGADPGSLEGLRQFVSKGMGREVPCNLERLRSAHCLKNGCVRSKRWRPAVEAAIAGLASGGYRQHKGR